MWIQKTFSLPPMQRGFHLVTSHILQNTEEIKQIEVGIFHLFIQHSSASLTINENADPTVRSDFESYFNDIVSEDKPYFLHTYEGSDDMPAHLKASLLGSSLSIPIANGSLSLGTWQGIYLCEHRNFGSSRSLVATINGESFNSKKL